MRLFGLEITRAKKEQTPVSSKQDENVIQKSSTNWERAFLTGRDLSIFGDAVARPYNSIGYVFMAVKAICDNIPQAELQFVDIKSKEPVQDPIEELFQTPNKMQSYADFIQEWSGFYALYGEGFILKTLSMGQAAGTSKLPAELWAVKPTLIREVLSQDRTELLSWKIGQKVIDLLSVIHSKDFNPENKFRGLGPTKPIENELNIIKSTIEFNKEFFDNDATPGLLLSTDKNLSNVQFERLKKSWQENHKGRDNRFNMDILEGGLKAENVTPTHKEMEFIEQARMMREVVLGTWRVPKALFNITDDLNYATYIGQMKIFWTYTLAPILRKFEDSINRHLVKPYNPRIMAKFNFKNVPAFQEDFNGKVEVGTKLFNMGFTGNEINEKLELGFEEKDWRDEWLVSPMLTPASKIIEDDFNSADDQPKQPVSPLSGNDNPSQDQPAELSSEDEGSKNKSVFKTPLQQKYVKAYLKRQDSLENRFERKMSKYFFELRMDLLKRPDAQLASGVVPIDWFKYDLQLQKATVPLIQESILGGVEQAKQATERKGIDEQLIDAQISQYLSIRGNKIQQINRTLQKQIAETIKKAIQAGESITGVALSIQEMSDIVRNELKNYFNNISYRSRLIARTETVGGLNNGSLIYYKEQGFTKKQWLTAGDDEVRVSHIECALQGEIPIDKAFTNGLDYPGDQGSGDAGEVVNCRCTLTAS